MLKNTTVKHHAQKSYQLTAQILLYIPMPILSSDHYEANYRYQSFLLSASEHIKDMLKFISNFKLYMQCFPALKIIKHCISLNAITFLFSFLLFSFCKIMNRTGDTAQYNEHV